MTDFAAIDFETANREPSSVCSVGVVVVRDGAVTGRFYSLTNHHNALADAEACAAIALQLL